ncbi:hypothetical protein F7734_11795 [Scytonema sp. UIC 10036]|nr:hypothetical protein [Scytonema sp. UIC 10036]
MIRTEQAIQKLLKEKKSINFGSVAQEAGVSRTWLYNQIEIRDKIEELRNKDLVKKNQNSKTSKTLETQTVTSTSKTSVVKELEQRIKKLETENLVLRQHLEVVYGMSSEELVRTVEVLQVENGELKRQIQEFSNISDNTAVSDLINRQLHERIYTLESEKAKLFINYEQVTQQLGKLNTELGNLDNLNSTNQKQADEIKQLQAALESSQRELREYQQRFSTTHPQDNLIKEDKIISNSNNALKKEFQDKCSELGIKLNKNLIYLIKSKTDEQVNNALSVVKERLDIGSKKVRSKAALFRSALENDWSPNESDAEREANTIKNTFSEWYELARDYGIVKQFKEENGIIMVKDNTDRWVKYEDFSAKWTLEYVRRQQRHKK